MEEAEEEVNLLGNSAPEEELRLENYEEQLIFQEE